MYARNACHSLVRTVDASIYPFGLSIRNTDTIFFDNIKLQAPIFALKNACAARFSRKTMP